MEVEVEVGLEVDPTELVAVLFGRSESLSDGFESLMESVVEARDVTLR